MYEGSFVEVEKVEKKRGRKRKTITAPPIGQYVVKKKKNNFDLVYDGKLYQRILLYHDKVKGKVITDDMLGDLLVQYDGHLYPIAYQYGIAISDLRNKIEKTPILKAVYEIIKSRHLENVEDIIIEKAEQGEEWAMKLLLSSKIAKQTGYAVTSQEAGNSSLNIALIMQQRLAGRADRESKPYTFEQGAPGEFVLEEDKDAAAEKE
jgi:hypothetical protein